MTSKYEVEKTPLRRRSVKRAAVGSFAPREKQFVSDAFEAIHSAASALHAVEGIDTKTMREYDALCIKSVPKFDKKAIVQIRKDAHVSQTLFAHYLNTSTSTVQQWESGQKKPSGMAAKLLQIVKDHGIEVLG